jgi:ketosteroid isomerase-like protein
MSVAATEHPNALRMRQVPDAVQRGDIASALEHFPEDVVWYSPSGDRVYRGHDGLRRFFGELFEASNGTMRPEVEDALGTDEHVVVFLRVTAARDGEELNVAVAHFATVGPAGFARNWFLPDDLTAWRRFFG